MNLIWHKTYPLYPAVDATLYAARVAFVEHIMRNYPNCFLNDMWKKETGDITQRFDVARAIEVAKQQRTAIELQTEI
jgi:hypothetical protein